MPEIGLSFNEKNFEYDVYTLIKAFYPRSEIKTWYEDETAKTELPDIKMSVQKTADSYVFTVCKRDEEPIIRSRYVEPKTDRGDEKNILKQLIYTTLAEFTKKELPWGDLTGIRPTKIPMSLLYKGWKNVDIAKYMRDTYFTGSKKTALAIAVANQEKYLLDEIEPENGYSLYVGIPFCPSICLYCSFGSHPLEKHKKWIRPYLDALYKELKYIAKAMEGKKLTTIYIGGGTPTSLDEDELGELLEVISDNFSFECLKEYTCEAGRPDTITEGKLLAMLANGVNRISINPQTMNQKTLDLIGRKHTVEQTTDAFLMAREVGFNNINMDLIVGLPGERQKEVGITLDKISELSPDSLTVHSLALKRSSGLNYLKDKYADISFCNSDIIMDMVEKTAGKLGMRPYYLYRQKNIAGNLENVGYARNGCFGLYNILIMEEKQTIMAAGSGAISKFVYDDGRIERADNVKDIYNYTDRIDEMIQRKEKELNLYMQSQKKQ